MERIMSSRKTAPAKKTTKDTTVTLSDFTDDRCKDIEERYSIKPSDSAHIKITQAPSKATRISDVFTSGVDLAHPFLDEAKKEKRVVPTMIQRLTSDGQLPHETTINCFWCRHSFDSPPIGCPIRFVSSQLCKRYISEITKDPYLIKENITSEKKVHMVDREKPEGISLTLVEKDYYETDGIFCSFNCCLAWLDEVKHVPMYVQSKQLLFKMYLDTYGSFSDIIKAPHWRLLRQYGGHLTIEEFRESFNSVSYTQYNKISTRPKMHTIGFLFEEKHKF